jgi:hypothetical protein
MTNTNFTNRRDLQHLYRRLHRIKRRLLLEHASSLENDDLALRPSASVDSLDDSISSTASLSSLETIDEHRCEEKFEG